MTVQLWILLQRDQMKREMLSWIDGENVWMGYLAPIMGERGFPARGMLRPLVSFI